MSLALGLYAGRAGLLASGAQTQKAGLWRKRLPGPSWAHEINTSFAACRVLKRFAKTGDSGFSRNALVAGGQAREGLMQVDGFGNAGTVHLDVGHLTDGDGIVVGFGAEEAVGDLAERFHCLTSREGVDVRLFQRPHRPQTPS
jgi:hypothetical protein